MIEMNADMKVQGAIHSFKIKTNMHPNRIIMGYGLVDEICKQYHYNDIPIKTLGELVKEKELGFYCEYAGIPIMIDEYNPNTLEVGYMIKPTENIVD